MSESIVAIAMVKRDEDRSKNFGELGGLPTQRDHLNLLVAFGLVAPGAEGLQPFVRIAVGPLLPD